MPIYVNRNGQQTGPYEDQIVVDRLQSGALSPDDLGIRQGKAEWRKLGEMFPGVAPKSAQVGAAFTSPVSVVAEPEAKGGCRKIGGIVMLIFGVLFLLGGTGGAIVNRMMEPATCEIADKYEREMNEAVKEADNAKGTSREEEAQAKALDKIESAEIWTKGCVEAKSTQNIFMIGLLAVAGLGFLMAIVGFFVRRV